MVNLKEFFEKKASQHPNQKVVEINTFQDSEDFDDFFHEPEDDDLKAILEAMDPSFIIYMRMAEFLMMVSGLAVFDNSLKKMTNLIKRLEKKYLPGDAISNISESFFNFWKLLDLIINEKNETIAALAADLAHYFDDNSEGLCELINKASMSRMGIYVHCGAEEGLIKLREIVTDNIIHAICPTSYEGKVGEIWFVRIFPPVNENTYPIIMTTPYIILNSTEDDWLRFFSKKGIKKGFFDTDYKLLQFMKYGPRIDYWLKYVNQTPLLTPDDAEYILLAGTP